MIKLEYFDGKNWILVNKFPSEWQAWVSLGWDCANYRTVDKEGNVLTDKSIKKENL